MAGSDRPPVAPDAAQALARVIAQDRGRLLAALGRVLGDLDLAEDALSDAMESALVHWSRAAVPDRPDGWLLTVARRKALDKLRRRTRHAAGPAQVARLLHDEAQGAEVHDIPDDRLRLIFACCHPALDRKSSVALTLRSIAGLSTPAIARAFLDNDSTMGQRITRAKAKIAAAGIPFAIPEAPEWPDRLARVQDVIWLIFNAGYVPPQGDDPGADLCDEAIFLCGLLDRLRPEDPEIEGMLAMLLFIHARRGARWRGAMLADQDPRDWNADMIARAQSMLDRAIARLRPGPYQIMAAIQALHIEAGARGQTDWRQVVLLYASLLRFQDTPVIRLNYAVALGEAGHVDAASAMLSSLAEVLDGYQPYHAARAAFLARMDHPDTQQAYERALRLTTNDGDRAFLREQQAHHEARQKARHAKKKAEHAPGPSPTGR